MSEYIILIIIILIVLLFFLYSQKQSSYVKYNSYNLNNNHYDNKKNDATYEYVLDIDDSQNIDYITTYKTSIDTIDLYPDYYPYTFGYKPYYYRLYPYPLNPKIN